LSIGDERAVVEIADFPEGWVLIPGDRLVLDLLNRAVFPYTVVEQHGQELVFLTVNVDEDAVRAIATYSSETD
jgi:hypothetical protein